MSVRTSFTNLKKMLGKGDKKYLHKHLYSIGIIHHFFTSCGSSPMKSREYACYREIKRQARIHAKTRWNKV